MPVPSQGHYGFHSFPVVDWFCLFIYLWVLTFPLEDCSEFGNFAITLICYRYTYTLWYFSFISASSLCTRLQPVFIPIADDMKKLAAIIPANQYYRFVITKKHHYFTK
jgi:hypothetical protein